MWGIRFWCPTVTVLATPTGFLVISSSKEQSSGEFLVPCGGGGKRMCCNGATPRFRTVPPGGGSLAPIMTCVFGLRREASRWRFPGTPATRIYGAGVSITPG